mmetsp:Transcript_51908/g.121699  ORF Transcript_51908/g.121699 Transcript_51908/m.121699 type:complete len:234 (-) Transcript_51908:69-770(-)
MRCPTTHSRKNSSCLSGPHRLRCRRSSAIRVGHPFPQNRQVRQSATSCGQGIRFYRAVLKSLAKLILFLRWKTDELVAANRQLVADTTYIKAIRRQWVEVGTIRNEICQIHNRAKRLSFFINGNSTGYRKILKKHTKMTGHSLLQPLVDEIKALLAPFVATVDEVTHSSFTLLADVVFSGQTDLAEKSVASAEQEPTIFERLRARAGPAALWQSQVLLQMQGDTDTAPVSPPG